MPAIAMLKFMHNTSLRKLRSVVEYLFCNDIQHTCHITNPDFLKDFYRECLGST
jgi:hypothetical protein